MLALDLLDAARSPYHVAAAVRAELERAGFVGVDDVSAFTPAPGGKYFTMRGAKTICAWVQADAARPVGLRLMAAHTDFPALKVKPNGFSTARGCALVEADIYDGPVLRSWLDRDLTVAGRVFFKGPDGVVSRLTPLDALTLRTVSIAPHFLREKDGGGVTADKDLRCIFDLAGDDARAAFFARLCAGLDLDPADVIEFDLFLTEAGAPGRAGADGGLISSGRLDNVVSCASCVQALLATASTGSPFTRMLAFFDAEEIGSLTWSGARSDVLTEVARVSCFGGAARGDEAFRNASSHLSVDVAHATHPGHGDKLDAQNAPELGRGVTLKYGSRGRYATSPALSAHLRWLADRAELPVQSFMYRPDGPGGGSLGPYVAAGLGIRSADLGAPVLSMHSIRELGAMSDIDGVTSLLSAYLANSAQEAFGAAD